MKNNLTEGHPLKVLLKFSIPLLIGNLFQQLYNIIDSIIVGNYVGYRALAAVGQSFPIMLVFIAFIIGIAAAANIMVGQYVGAKKIDEVQIVVDTILISNILFSLVVLALGYIFTPLILRLINTPDDIFSISVLYLRIIFLAMPFLFGYNGIASLFRGFGNSKTPLYGLTVSIVLNIALDLLFIIKFNMGVEGVAIATAISQFIAMVFLIILIKTDKYPLKITFTKLKFDPKILLKLIKIGFPIGLQQALIGLALATMIGFVNSFGSIATAGYSAAMKVDGFAFLPIQTFAIALSTYTAQNVGAKNFDRVKKGLFWGNILSLSSILILGSLVIIFSKQILLLFVSNQDVIKVGQSYFYIVVPSYIFQSIVFTHMGVVRGYGETVAPLIVTVLNLWVFRLPLAYLFRYFNPVITSLWWAIVIGFFAGMIVMLTYYHKGKWRNKTLV